MKKKFNAKDVLIPTIALFLIASVCTAILAFTNSITYAKIQENNEKTKNETRSAVFPDALSFSEDKTVSADSEEIVYNEAYSGYGDVIGYVFTASDKGYGGTVTVMTGIDADGNLSGVETIELSETAGLGMNAKKASFRDQFKEKTGPFIVSKDSQKNDGTFEEINALTGATITSRAVTSAVNKTVAAYKALTGGGNNG